jgi:hypothetical protein
MNEPLFSPSASNWTALLPALGWMQSGLGSSPGPLGGSGFAALPGALPTVQQGQQAVGGAVLTGQTPQAGYPPTYAPPPPAYGFSTGIALLPQPGLVFGPSGAGVAPMLAVPSVYGVPGISPAIPQELPVGLAAPAILAAVAVRRGQPMGPTSDQEIEEFVYDVLELLPGTSEVEVRCEGGRATLTGSVQHKRLKHDVGEIVWAIQHVADVQNNVTIATKRRTRSTPREAEAISAPAGRKQA